MKANFAYLFLALIVAFSSCSKEGDPGPQGPKGEPGIEGAEGPEGPQGDPGTVNVIYSEWQMLDFSEISPDLWEAEWSGISALTESTVQSSIVAIYLRTTGSDEIFPLVSLDESQTVYVHRVAPGSIFLRTDIAMDFYETAMWFRYVIVPAEINARVYTVDLADYQAVKKTYGLPD